MRLYICGPMTGILDFNFPAFNAAAKLLTGVGFLVVNPVDVNPDPGTPWKDCMKRDIITMLQDCGGVALLDIEDGKDWRGSRGARLETHIATELEMPVHYVSDWLILQTEFRGIVQKLPKINRP